MSQSARQAPDKLQVAVDVAFQPGTDNAELLGDIRARTLQMHGPVLNFREYSGRKCDGKGNADRRNAGQAGPCQNMTGSNSGKNVFGISSR